MMLVVVIFISGCINNTDVTYLVKNLPQVEQFLKENPDADIKVVKLNENYVSSIITDIRKKCGEQMEIKPYYFVTLITKNINATMYLDIKTQELICIYKEPIIAGATQPKSNVSSGVAPPNATPPPLIEQPENIVLEYASIDFSQYPYPFIKNGKWNNVVVVGEGAPASDIIAATDIAATLATQVNLSALGVATTVDVVTPLGVAATDTELTDIQKKENLILIGSPDVNRLTAELAGVAYPANTPYCSGGNLDCATGVGMMMLFKNPYNPENVVLIITGNEIDKRNAANVLKDYKSYISQLRGQKIIVKLNNGVITIESEDTSPIKPIVI